MSEEIIFTNTLGFDTEYKPQPAINFIPEWYKQMDTYVNKTGVPDNLGGKGTIKKCMPVFDSLTTGYIIVTHVDIWVQHIPNQPSYYTWKDFNPIAFHGNAQASTYKPEHKFDFPKFINPWAIKTPKGYSSLFIPPMNRQNIISIFPGIVDTDKYTLNVEFPFLLTDPTFDGLIPAGTPIAQIIPFKRDKWKMKFGTKKENENNKKIKIDLASHYYNVYKNKYRTSKEYK